VFFDLNVISPSGASITALAINTSHVVPFEIDVYLTPSTYVGKDASAAAWTLVRTGKGLGMNSDVPSIVTFSPPLPLATGTYGIGLHHRTAYLKYTKARARIQSYSNADLAVTSHGPLALWSGSAFNPRVWNGTIWYDTTRTRPRSCWGARLRGQQRRPDDGGRLAPKLGGSLQLTYSNLPLAAGSMTLMLGTSRTTYASQPLPLSLAFLNAGACNLYTSIDLTLAGVNTGGSGLAFLPIPAAAALLGQEVFLADLLAGRARRGVRGAPDERGPGGRRALNGSRRARGRRPISRARRRPGSRRGPAPRGGDAAHAVAELVPAAAARSRPRSPAACASPSACTPPRVYERPARARARLPQHGRERAGREEHALVGHVPELPVRAEPPPERRVVVGQNTCTRPRGASSRAPSRAGRPDRPRARERSRRARGRTVRHGIETLGARGHDVEPSGPGPGRGARVRLDAERARRAARERREQAPSPQSDLEPAPAARQAREDVVRVHRAQALPQPAQRALVPFLLGPECRVVPRVPARELGLLGQGERAREPAALALADRERELGRHERSATSMTRRAAPSPHDGQLVGTSRVASRVRGAPRSDAPRPLTIAGNVRARMPRSMRSDQRSMYLRRAPSSAGSRCGCAR
jgi:hypothetical protein